MSESASWKTQNSNSFGPTWQHETQSLTSWQARQHETQSVWLGNRKSRLHFFQAYINKTWISNWPGTEGSVLLTYLAVMIDLLMRIYFVMLKLA